MEFTLKRKNLLLGELTLIEKGGKNVVLCCCFTSMVNNYGTLFLGRPRPPKQLTSTKYIYFSQLLTTAPLESAEGRNKVCDQTGF